MSIIRLEYFSLSYIMSPSFSKKARTEYISHMTKDYIWVCWRNINERSFIDCTSKIFPTSKIINPDVELILYYGENDTFKILWKDSYDWHRIENMGRDILKSWIFE